MPSWPGLPYPSYVQEKPRLIMISALAHHLASIGIPVNAFGILVGAPVVEVRNAPILLRGGYWGPGRNIWRKRIMVRDSRLRETTGLSLTHPLLSAGRIALHFLALVGALTRLPC
ncbi:uncharacterized protein BDV17DRAFT_255006 [Aspergillus undulatus]|uniref:uncharacterized protein n=1 Tax=Aspergillus undulatus TaxID=1810928 RepID=UPI003CCE0B5F